MNPDILEGQLTPQDLFNLNLDTQARWDKITSMKNNFDVPVPPKFPEYNLKTDPLNPDTQMSIYQGLFSNNPHIKEQAEGAVNENLKNDPNMMYNVGFKIDTPLDQAQKYVGKEFGFDPTRDNEQFYHDWQYEQKGLPGKVWDNLYKGVGRFAGGVITKLGQGIGQLGAFAGYGIAKMFNPNGVNVMEHVAENSFTKWFEQAEETIKDQWMPIYKPSDWNSKGFWSKLGSGQYWSDELSDGAAFMGSMIAESYLAGGLGEALGLGRLGAATITGSGKLANLSRAALRFTTGAEDLGGVGTWALSVGGEAMMEASDGFKTVKQQLRDQRDSGKNNYSDDQINEIAGNRAAGRFRANLAILSISNAFENRMIFQPLLKSLKGKVTFNPSEEAESIASGVKVSHDLSSTENLAKATVDKQEFEGLTDRLFNFRKKLKNPQGAFLFYGKQAITAVAMEGFWEENAQLAAERLTNQGKLSFSNFWDQYAKQTSAAVKGNDPEAADNIGAGGVIGVLGSGGTSVVTRELPKLREATADAVDKYEKYRKAYLSFNDAWEKDEHGNFIPNENGVGYKINPERAVALLAGVNEHISKQVTADDVKDPVFRKYLQEQLLSDFVFAAKQAGIHNEVTDRFNSLGNLTKDQISQLGFDPNTKENIPAFQKSFEEQSKIYDDVFLSKKGVNRPSGVNEKEFFENDTARRYTLYSSLTSQRSTKNALDAYTSLSLQNTPNALQNPSSIFQLHNSLMFQLALLHQYESSLPKESTFYNEYFNNRKMDLYKSLIDASKQMAEFQQVNKGINNIQVVDPESKIDEERNVDPEAYKEFFDEKGNFIDDKKDQFLKKFTREREDFVRHGALQNSLAQQQYVSDKLNDPKKGYNNFLEYKGHNNSVSAADAEMEKILKTKKEKEEEDRVKAEQDANENNIANKIISQQPLAEDEQAYYNSNKDALDAKVKQKQKEAENQKKAEEEKAKKEFEEWAKKHPKEALLMGIKSNALEMVNKSNLPQEQKDQFAKDIQSDDWNKISDALLNIFSNTDQFDSKDLQDLDEAIDRYIEMMNDEIKNGKSSVISPEEQAIEDQLGKEKADEARAFVKEGLDNEIIPASFVDMAKTSPLGFMKFIAEQAQAELNGVSNRPSTESTFGESTVKYAEELFPAPAKETAPVKENGVLGKILGKFSIATEQKVNHKTPGKNEGRTVRRDIKVSKTSDGEVIKIEPHNTFTDNGNTLITGGVRMTLQEFKDKFYPLMSKKDIDFFEETIEGLDFKNVFFKEARIGLDGIYKGQVNIDVLMDGSVDNTIVLNIKLNDAELSELSNLEVKEVKVSKEVKEKEVKEVKEVQPKSNNGLTDAAQEALKEAYDLQSQVVGTTKTYEQLLRELGIYQNENKIDEAVDKGKMAGLVVLPTMKPNEITQGDNLTVSEKPYLQARFNFIQRLSDKGNTNDYKLVLYVETKNGKSKLKGKVGDKNGRILKFNSDGIESDNGVDVIFDLDLISYNNDSLGKERVEASGKKIDPLKKALNNFKLHESFENNVNVDEQILHAIANSPASITASIKLVTQGQLVRPGITNSPNSLTDLSGERKTLSQLKSEGKVFNNENGRIPLKDSNESNTFLKSGRIEVRLRRDVKNNDAGYEIVEFIPNKLSQMVDAKGNSIESRLRDIFEKAVKGELSAEYEGFLKNFINRREFLILPLGQNLIVINKKALMKKLPTFQSAMSSDDLYKILTTSTSVDEIMNSEFNIDSPLYEKTDDYKKVANDFPDDVSDLIEHYQDVVNNNITSSAKEVQVSPEKRGFARVNKRLVVTLDQSFEDMKNNKIKEEQELASDPNKLKVNIEDNIDDSTAVDILTSEELKPVEESASKIIDGLC